MPLTKEQSDVYESILALPKQCVDAMAQAKKLKLPASHKRAKKIIVAGMGGSNLGARLIQSVFAPSFAKSIDIVNHYQLPAYADKQTLVIAMSYSGNTEESLMVAQQAHKKRVPVLVIATGGQLIKWAKHKKVPALQLTTEHNPSNQPRLGIGYSLFALLPIIAKLGLKVSDRDLKKTVSHLLATAEEWEINAPELTNTPKKIASLLHGFIPVYVASEHLTGNLRIIGNQTHETAKSFAAAFPLPELNHHLMEGLKNPKTYTSRLRFVALNSHLYSARNQKRMAVTKDVVEQQTIRWVEYKPQDGSRLTEACEALLFSSLMTFYLSLLYQENPVIVPWVDYFKAQLAQ